MHIPNEYEIVNMKFIFLFLIVIISHSTQGQTKTDTTIVVLKPKRHVKAYNPNGKNDFDYIYTSPESFLFIYGDAPDSQLNLKREVRFFYEGNQYLGKKSDFLDLSGDQWDIIRAWTNKGEDKRRLSAERISKQLKALDSLRKERERLTSILEIHTAIKSGLVFMWTWNEDGAYVKSQGFNFEIVNPVKKKIKYVYVDVAIYNPVGDFISKKNLTLIGPIEYSQKSSYNFENVFFSRIAESAKILAVKVQYFDGTVKLFTGTNLKNILVNPIDYEIFLDDSKKHE